MKTYLVTFDCIALQNEDEEKCIALASSDLFPRTFALHCGNDNLQAAILSDIKKLTVILDTYARFIAYTKSIFYPERIVTSDTIITATEIEQYHNPPTEEEFLAAKNSYLTNKDFYPITKLVLHHRDFTPDIGTSFANWLLAIVEKIECCDRKFELPAIDHYAKSILDDAAFYMIDDLREALYDALSSSDKPCTAENAFQFLAWYLAFDTDNHLVYTYSCMNAKWYTHLS